MKQLFADASSKNGSAQARITTFGPSGIGFVNFGLVRDLHLQALIETFGQGSFFVDVSTHLNFRPESNGP
jgi:hypothetical protein